MHAHTYKMMAFFAKTTDAKLYIRQLAHVWSIQSIGHILLCFIFMFWPHTILNSVSGSTQISKQALYLNDQVYSCLIHLRDNCTATLSVMEDDLWRKTTFDERWPLTQYDLWRKMTFDGRWPLTGDNLWRKTIFEGRRPSTEDNLQWKTTFNGRCPLKKTTS